MKTLGLFLAVIILACPVYAQKTMTIDVDKVLQRCETDISIHQLFRAKEKLARAKYEKAKKWWWPTLYGGVKMDGLLGTTQNSDGRFFRDVAKHHLWTGIGINAQWDLKEKYNVRASAYEERSQQYASKAAVEDRSIQAVEHYYHWMHAITAFDAYNALIAKASDIAAQFNLQVQGGLKPQSDYLMAKSRVKMMEVKALTYYRISKEEEAQLVSMLGWDAGTQIEPLDSVFLPLNLVNLQPPNWDADIKNDPKIRLRRIEIESLQAQRDRFTKGRWLPRLYINSNGSLFGGTFNPFDPTGIFQVGAVWKLPLHQLKGNVDLQVTDAKINTLESTLPLLREERQNQVMQAYYDIQSEEQSLLIAEAARDYAWEAYQMIEKRQKNGVAQPLALFQAQENAVQTTLDYIKIVAEFNAAQYRYLILTKAN